jgi:holo-[acyl-carrier protein] synthase
MAPGSCFRPDIYGRHGAARDSMRAHRPVDRPFRFRWQAVSLRLTQGIDVIEIERIQHAVERWGERFLRRVYTEGEIAYCRGRAQSLAGRFAAKEAASKALGVGIRTLSWRDIEVLPDARGKPLIFLHGKAARVAQWQRLERFEVSITHSRSDALAVVTAWGEE